MAETIVEVCNLALVQVGQTDTLEDLADDSEAARVCSVAYPLSLASVLAAFAWPFATRRQTLALLGEELRDGWLFLYALPTDCVAPQYIWGGVVDPAPELRIPYAVEGDATTGKKVLLTNEEDALLVYTSNATAVNRYPALFVDALAWNLSLKLALGLAKKPPVAQMAAGAYKQALAEAKAAELRQRQHGAMPKSRFVTGRS